MSSVFSSFTGDDDTIPLLSDTDDQTYGTIGDADDPDSRRQRVRGAMQAVARQLDTQSVDLTPLCKVGVSLTGQCAISTSPADSVLLP